MKSYPAYKDSGIEWIGEIPEHWSVCKLKRITRLLYGESLSEVQRSDGSIPVYGSNGIVGFHNIAITNNPCIIIGRKGSHGKVNFSEVACFPIDTTYFIDSKATNNDLKWLKYLLPNLKLDSFTQDSAVPGLSREEAYEKQVALPPLPEQQAIANYLDDKTSKIDTLIEKKQRLIELLKEQRTAIINQAVTKGINPNAKMQDSGIEWLGEIPEGWRTKKLKYVTDFVNGAAFKPSDWKEAGVPIIRIENLNGGEEFNYSSETIDSKYHVRKGDLLFAWSGNRGTSFGPFLWQKDGLHYLNQHIYRLEYYPFEKKWFYWSLKAVTTHVESEAQGIIGLVHITKVELGSISYHSPNSKLSPTTLTTRPRK